MSDCVINRMTSSDIPHITIKNNFQKRHDKYSDILTNEILKEICFKATGCSKYTIDWVNETNHGRLVKIKHNGKTSFISLGQDGEIEGRNSTIQSFGTALKYYHEGKKSKKKIFFYFLPYTGNLSTQSIMFYFKMMKGARIKFLNPEKLGQDIIAYNSIDEIIAERAILKKKKSSNNSSYITRNAKGDVEIYAKSYGASKYEAFLIAMTVAKILQKQEPNRKVILNEITEGNLKTLPQGSRDVLKELRNVKLVKSNKKLDKILDTLVYPAGLRSPRYLFNLLSKLGAKKCAFCDVDDPKEIEGAHIDPVASIKKRKSLSEQDKISLATEKDNGIWLCKRHHKQFDNNHIRMGISGKLQITKGMQKKINRKNTPITQIDRFILTLKFIENLKRRNRDPALRIKNYVEL